MRNLIIVFAAFFYLNGHAMATEPESFRDCDVCPELIEIQGKRFPMGDLVGDGSKDERPAHMVDLAYQFAVGKYEVTFDEWDACVAAGGCSHTPEDEGWGRGRRPVINVSWDDTHEFTKWLSSKTGKTYRLLSEAEFEFLARAGTTTRWPCGDKDSCLDGIAWLDRNSGGKTQPVGMKAANAFGIHDLLGNVYEWVEDCLNFDYEGAPTDGSAWTKGNCDRRVLRGGSWDSDSWLLRSAYRFKNDIMFKTRRYNGFRIARNM